VELQTNQWQQQVASQHEWQQVKVKKRAPTTLKAVTKLHTPARQNSRTPPKLTMPSTRPATIANPTRSNQPSYRGKRPQIHTESPQPRPRRRKLLLLQRQQVTGEQDATRGAQPDPTPKINRDEESTLSDGESFTTGVDTDSECTDMDDITDG